MLENVPRKKCNYQNLVGKPRVLNYTLCWRRGDLRKLKRHSITINVFRPVVNFPNKIKFLQTNLGLDEVAALSNGAKRK